MNPTELSALRLQNQQLSSTEFRNPGELVSWMGALQAQDYPMSKWAIGSRLRHLDDGAVEAALNRGEILRTHVLRPTWHLVTPENIHWMLELTAPRIRPVMQAMNRQLELTPAVFSRCNRILEKTLGDGIHRTRDELMRIFKKSKINTASFRSAHIMLNAELDGLVCSGAVNMKKQTYTLLPLRVPKKIKWTREESLARLAAIYFQSHGPATVADFSWWSGLTKSDAGKGIEFIQPELQYEKSGDQTYWFQATGKPLAAGKSFFLLPAYDEFLISYQDRSAVIPVKHHQKYKTLNGIFAPAIAVNGRIAGTWKRTVSGKQVEVTPFYFEPLPKSYAGLLKKEIAAYTSFLKNEIH